MSSANLYLTSETQGKISYNFSNTNLVFSNNSTDILQLDASGNVGIGTDSPAAKLDVAGDIYPATTLTYDLGTTAKRWKDLYLSGSSIVLGDTTITTENGALVLPDVSSLSSTADIGISAADNAIFYTGELERMRIDNHDGIQKLLMACSSISRIDDFLPNHLGHQYNRKCRSNSHRCQDLHLE